MVAPLESE